MLMNINKVLMKAAAHRIVKSLECQSEVEPARIRAFRLMNEMNSDRSQYFLPCTVVKCEYNLASDVTITKFNVLVGR